MGIFCDEWRLRSHIACAILSTAFAVTQAQEANPTIRINGGMHGARIEEVVADGSGQLLLTASHDKTARLWSSVDGRLIQVFRPPLGNGNEGKLNAAALSPDGSLAAMAGLTGYEWDESVSVYLFDTVSGRMQMRFTKLPNLVFDLAFSSTGRFLAAGLAGGEGVRVWETANGRLVGSADGFGDNCHAVDWRGDELLATTCLDGSVRLYRMKAGQMESQTTKAFPGGSPFSASIAPDGQSVAVGFMDKPRVEVLSLPSLDSLFTPEVSGIGNGNLKAVRWSRDGTRLYAAGHWDLAGGNPVRTWDQRGQRVTDDVTIPANFLHAMNAQGDKAVVLAGGGPVWAVVQDGKVLLQVDSPLAQWEHTFGAFRCSADGRKISFAWFEDTRAIGMFDIEARTLVSQVSKQSLNSLNAPALHGLDVRGWCSAANETERSRALSQRIRESDLGGEDGSTKPTLAGQSIQLVRHDISRSVCGDAKGGKFTLGSDFRLTRYESNGEQLWSNQSPAISWVVNETTDGRLVMAGHEDGTIRWYRESDGQEILALFPHADRKRWVVWTPEGYFDSSPGGEDLIGWHVNRRKDEAADFFPAARFRAIYYRPDVIQRVLKTRDVAEALRQANIALGRPDDGPAKIADVIAKLSPPVVELETGGVLGEVVLPPDAQSFDLSYRVRRTSKSRTERVEVRANGRPLDVKAPVPEGDSVGKITVPLPADFSGDVALIASHALSRSDTATVRVRRASTSAKVRTPKLFVIAVGAAELAMNQPVLLAANGLAKDRFNNLEFAANDAQKVGALLATQQGKGFEVVETKVLLNQQATTEAIRTAIREIGSKAELGDVLFFFFSGHGNHDPKSGKFHLVTHDTDPKRETETALSGEELSELLGAVRGYVVVALDACHSGAVLGMQQGASYKAPPLDISGLANQLSSAEHGIVVLSSSTPDQLSFEDNELGSGIFTKALLDGLSGKALENGSVTCSSLMKWLDKRVVELAAGGPEPAADSPATSQTPVNVMPKGVPDFVLVRP
jgi:WD40 repeat protein